MCWCCWWNNNRNFKATERLQPNFVLLQENKYSLAVQARVDSDYRFISLSAICTGSTHDSTCMAMSNMNSFIEDGNVPLGYWFAGGDAYQSSLFLLTPFRRAFLKPYADSYNYYQSSHRMHVEQAFGIRTSKWRVLKCPLNYELNRCTDIINATALLHSFCMESKNGDGPRDEVESYRLEEAEYDLQKWISLIRYQVDMDSYLDEAVPSTEDLFGTLNNFRKSKLRSAHVKHLWRHGLLRPAWARDKNYDERLKQISLFSSWLFRIETHTHTCKYGKLHWF